MTTSQHRKNRPTVAVVLAAGLGKRMGSPIPKVLHELRGKPLVTHVIKAIQEAGFERIVVVIGHKGEMVQEALSCFQVEFAWQRERLGTGHAVLQTESQLVGFDGNVLVLAGDVPGIRPETITSLIAEHDKCNAAATVLTVDMPDPSGYGRVIRNEDGTFNRIVEQKDASATEQRIREINSGTMVFAGGDLFNLLRQVGNDNSQGEYYLPDALEILRKQGATVAVWKAPDFSEIDGVNTPDQLARLQIREL